MAYCRHSEKDSDLYVIASVMGNYECFACPLIKKPYTSKVLKTARGMYNHLLKHRKAGHKVPQYAIDRFKKELNIK